MRLSLKRFSLNADKGYRQTQRWLNNVGLNWISIISPVYFLDLARDVYGV